MVCKHETKARYTRGSWLGGGVERVVGEGGRAAFPGRMFAASFSEESRKPSPQGHHVTPVFLNCSSRGRVEWHHYGPALLGLLAR